MRWLLHRQKYVCMQSHETLWMNGCVFETMLHPCGAADNQSFVILDNCNCHINNDSFFFPAARKRPCGIDMSHAGMPVQ
ncbi:hypothetical protein Plhal304r1_c056g0141661 [Plasmopara halstedii]